MTAVETWLARRGPYVAITATATGLALASFPATFAWAIATALLLLAAAGRASRVALVAALALAAGNLAGSARISSIDSAGERLEAGDGLVGVAHLSEAPRAGPFGLSAEVRMASGQARGVRLLARLPEGADLPSASAPGTELSLAGSFEPLPQGGSSDSGFAGYMRARGISGELTVERVRRTGGRRSGLQGAIDRIRSRSHEAIGTGLTSASAELARGMVIGADEAIPVPVRDDFRDSGLAHLLAVSGQNVVLLCALALPFLMAVGLPYRARAPVLIGLIALYVPLAGAGPSIQRAGVMGTAAIAAVALARPASRAYALGLAACVTLLANPRVWADPGWQLSFAAVTGILLHAPAIARSLSALPRILAEGIALTLAATIATTPLVAYHFGVVTLAGLPANVVALPLVAPIMWLGMSRAAVGQAVPVDGPVGEAAVLANQALGWLLAPLLSCLEDLAGWFADMPGAQIAVSLDRSGEVALAYLAIVGGVLAVKVVASRFDARVSTAVAYVRRLPRARRLLLVVGVASIALLILARGLAPPGPPGALTVSFLDVGQGDATLIQHPDGSAVLFDGGPPEADVVRLLRRAGVRRLSALVMTHASRDHHGGLADVVERLPIDVLVDGGDGSRDPSFRSVVSRAADRGARVVRAVAPEVLTVGAIGIEVLSPAPRPVGPPPADPNPRAVVAVVSCDGFDLLLSGDAESEALLAVDLPDVDAMKLPHHGSADPGLPEVLDLARPEIASIPVGPNTYGHPAPSTLSALRRADVTTWRNDRNGTVRVIVDDGAIGVEAQRGDHVSSAP